MIAHRMEEPVGVGHDAGGRERDHLIQAAGRFQRQLGHQALIDVGVCAGIAFQQVFDVTDDVHGAGRASQRECQVEHDRYSAADIDVTLQELEPLHLDRDVIRIGRQVAEGVLAGCVGRRGPGKSADTIADADLNCLHHAPRGVLHGPLQSSGATQALREGHASPAKSHECQYERDAKVAR